jgi:hypothetical protein
MPEVIRRQRLDPRTREPYSYAGEDPIDASDPTGQLCAFGYCLGFHPMAGADALVNIGRGASFGLSDTIANWISPGASCTVSQNSADKLLGSAAWSVIPALGIVRAAGGPVTAAEEGVNLASEARTAHP